MLKIVLFIHRLQQTENSELCLLYCKSVSFQEWGSLRVAVVCSVTWKTVQKGDI